MVHTFQWASSEFFFIPDFLAESLKANKNKRERSLNLQYSFGQKTSLILRISTLLTLKIICSQSASKKLSKHTNFPANMFLFGVRKKHLHCTISWRPRTSWSTLKANVSIFLCISLKKFFFQRHNRVLSRGLGGAWGGRGGWIIFLKRLAVCKMFYDFSFQLIFLEIQRLFSISILSSIVLKRWNFPDNLNFKGKIMTKLLIRSHFLSI